MEQKWVLIELPQIDGGVRLKEVYGLQVGANIILYVPATLQFLSIPATLICMDGKWYLKGDLPVVQVPNVEVVNAKSEVPVVSIDESQNASNELKMETIMSTLGPSEKNVDVKIEKPSTSNKDLREMREETISASSSHTAPVVETDKPIVAKGNKISVNTEKPNKEIPVFLNKNNKRNNRPNDNRPFKPAQPKNENTSTKSSFGSNW